MEIKIYYQDTDCGGVVYYANYLTYFERSRTEWLQERGVSVKELAENNILFVVTHAEIFYRSPACYGETILVRTSLEKATKVRLEFRYSVTEKKSGREIVSGNTTLACIDGSMKPRPIPEDVKKRLA